jgi:excisionase family DNA binding protein
MLLLQVQSYGGMGMEVLLSVEEAARRLGGISKWTVHAWLAKGKLRRTKVGARTMIRESELQRVIRDEGDRTADVVR